jgi:cyclophilin family peptidyl-prolyl cis-trans isomerase
MLHSFIPLLAKFYSMIYRNSISIFLFAILLGSLFIGWGTPLAHSQTKTIKQAKAELDAEIKKWKQSAKGAFNAFREFGICDKPDAEKWRGEWRRHINEGNLHRDQVAQRALQLFKLAAGTSDSRTAGLVLENMMTYDYDHNRYDRAYKMTSEILEIEPENYPLRIRLIQLCLMTNRFDEASEIIEQLYADGDTQIKIQFKSFPEMLAKWQEEKKLRADEADDNLPRVKIETNQGAMVFELFENEAPETVANFISLVRSGFYEKKKFHRVLKTFMAQTGCPNGDGSGDAGYSIYDEHNKDKIRYHFRGVLSMANTGQPNTGGSQFFITLSPQFGLDGKHAVFGRIISGQEVLERLTFTHKSVTEQGEKKEKPIDAIISDQIIKIYAVDRDGKQINSFEKEYVPNKVGK